MECIKIWLGCGRLVYAALFFYVCLGNGVALLWVDLSLTIWLGLNGIILFGE